MRRFSTPKGPFRRAQIERVLRSRGYECLSAEEGEFTVFEHPLTKRRVPVNPDWKPFFFDDPVFRVLCRDTGMEPNQLAAKLSADHAAHPPSPLRRRN